MIYCLLYIYAYFFLIFLFRSHIYSSIYLISEIVRYCYIVALLPTYFRLRKDRVTFFSTWDNFSTISCIWCCYFAKSSSIIFQNTSLWCFLFRPISVWTLENCVDFESTLLSKWAEDQFKISKQTIGCDQGFVSYSTNGAIVRNPSWMWAPKLIIFEMKNMLFC